MMLLLTILAVFLILVASELWWRFKKPHDELSRKFVHITVGSFAASWPWYLEREQIVLLAVAFAAGVIVSKFFGIFRAIHAVQRPTWGEVSFAAAVGVLAVIADNPWLYAVALLHMSLADGLAALVGTKYGYTNRYRVFGHYKSLAGTATFFVVSCVLLVVFSIVAESPLPLLFVAPIAAFAALLENFAVRGLDNLLVPLFIVAALSLLG